MRPITHSDGHDAPGLIDEFIPGLAAVIDNIVVGMEDPVGYPVVAHELPDVFGRIEFWAFGWQRNEGDVCRHDDAWRQMPSCLIDQQHGMRARRHFGGDLRQMQVHRLDIAGWKNERGALALFGADGAEDIGGGGALIVRGRGACAAPCPTPRDLVLLPDAGFVREPYLYGCGIDVLLARDLVQTGGEVFLYSSMAPSTWA